MRRRVLAATIAGLLACTVGAWPSAVAQTPPQRRPDVRYLPTPQNVVEAMLEFVHVRRDDVVYDLGSGDGRIPITAAVKYGARGVGIEIDPTLVRLSEENARKAGVADRVRFVTGDLFQADIREATVVALFLMPGMNIELIPKFRAQLRPGARIVGHHFAMGDRWMPDAERDVNGLMIYRWEIAGNW
jgi:cyclopropane fatty-acyl-phospholipid synthase-like methyltransferase